MTAPQLGAASLQLLETVLDSYEKLEIVRAVRDLGKLDPSSLLERLRIDANDLATSIDALVAARIVRREGRAHLVLGEAGDDPAIAELMAIYQQDQVLVITTLSSLVVGRLRNMAANAFADAFVLRKKKGGDDDG